MKLDLTSQPKHGTDWRSAGRGGVGQGAERRGRGGNAKSPSCLGTPRAPSTAFGETKRTFPTIPHYHCPTSTPPGSSTTTISHNQPARQDRTFQSLCLSSFTMSTAELASSYAALILADDNVEITVRSIPTPQLPSGPCHEMASRIRQKSHLEIHMRQCISLANNLILKFRPTSSRPSSRPLVSLTLSPSGLLSSPRYIPIHSPRTPSQTHEKEEKRKNERKMQTEYHEQIGQQKADFTVCKGS